MYPLNYQTDNTTADIVLKIGVTSATVMLITVAKLFTNMYLGFNVNYWSTGRLMLCKLAKVTARLAGSNGSHATGGLLTVVYLAEYLETMIPASATNFGISSGPSTYSIDYYEYNFCLRLGGITESITEAVYCDRRYRSMVRPSHSRTC